MMTKTSTQTLYSKDFALWVEETVNQLKAKEFNQVDWDNLIEEIESLAKKDKRELESRLTTLFEHALKRQYVPLPDCYRGWEVTISRTQQELNLILRDSPSLGNYFLQVIDECYKNALKNIRKEYDTEFPDAYLLTRDVDRLLTEDFWKAR
ncbi:protein of unknown function DUF29 [Gloeothece citriformis PCC 7424]|uniref:DUF29 domain-containing protein n=2 Tax=Gloeothece TaxID=28070 RepID=B7KE42_GLOC7|nr:DUF29 domain-containing protein [Gloeothece citriformis]ACK71740.1 protein of unknown function DUF29 [Gloeothece citriformis PCC 7424]